MAANDAFTAGVRPGGLTDSTEIRLLLCYLVKNAGPITRTEIENALMEEQLVNYFEIGSCLDDITRQQLVTLKEDRYSITEKGRKVAQELAYDLPRSVRERAVAAVLRSQTWARKEAKYSASITEKPDGHCSVRCTVKGLDEALFCLDLGTPDRLSAELVKKQFILKGNEIYQLLVNKLTEETNCMNARIEVENCMQELRSYLGIQEDLLIKVRIDNRVPDLHIDLDAALMLANENSPEIQNMLRRKVESESAVSRAKANAGLKADIYLRFGLTQTADKLKDAYRNPLDQQYVSLGITLPILDWGRGRGQVRVARSNRDLVYTQVEQDKTDFDLNVRKLVKQFNLQAQRVNIAARTDHTAQRRAEVARKLYLLGKSSVLDLNASITEKDTARRSYITALYNYWSLYYALRSITLYDFEKERPLAEDLERVTNEESIQ